MNISFPVSVAVVLTCYNRREKTAACLRALADQAKQLAGRCTLRVIVTDDGSTDGTREMLASEFPQAVVIPGDGNLFWAGGMRAAIGHALGEGHDFYLWINDDVELFPSCLGTLLDMHDAQVGATGKSGLVVGSMCNAAGQFTYGGMVRQGNGWVRRYVRVQPGDTPQPCDTMNGNCVLISRAAASVLGNMDAAFRHGIGDMDYGLRATRAGIPIWVMPGYAGRCAHDHLIEGSYLDRTLPLAVRWKKITSPKGLAPRAWLTYCRRHAGWLWPLHWAWPYTKVMWTSVVYRLAHPDKSSA
jgi:GT2 family glycosyltransferase